MQPEKLHSFCTFPSYLHHPLCSSLPLLVVVALCSSSPAPALVIDANALHCRPPLVVARRRRPPARRRRRFLTSTPTSSLAHRSPSQHSLSPTSPKRPPQSSSFRSLCRTVSPMLVGSWMIWRKSMTMRAIRMILFRTENLKNGKRKFKRYAHIMRAFKQLLIVS